MNTQKFDVDQIMHEYASTVWGTLEMKVARIAKDNPEDLREKVTYLAHDARSKIESFSEKLGFHPSPTKQVDSIFQEMVEHLMKDAKEYQAQRAH